MKEPSRFVARSTPRPRTLQLPALAAARARDQERFLSPEPVPKLVPEPGPEPQIRRLPPPSPPLHGVRVSVGVPSDAETTGGRPAELARAVLLSRDVELAQALASIAVGAGIELVLAHDGAHPEACGNEVILVGADAVAELGAIAAGCTLILTGTQEHQDILWRAAAASPGARVAILPQATAWLGEYLGELGLHAGRAHVTIVAGARGGVGTSTFAALLAASATLAGQRTLLLDADPHSPGFWPVLRARAADGLGWEDLENSRGQLSPGQLAEILPLAQGTAVLSWIRDPGAFVPSVALLSEVLAASRRIYERIVIDAGHIGSVPAAMTALATTRLLLLGAGSSYTPGAGQRLGDQAHPWRLIVSGKLTSGTDTRIVAQRAGLELAGYFAPRRSIARAAAAGGLMNVLVHRSLRRTMAQLGQGSEPAQVLETHEAAAA